MEHATLMLATSQLGITICSLLILNVSEPAIHHLLDIPLAATGLTDSAISVTAFTVALVLVTFLHVVFGEMVPKNLSFSVPGRAALLLAPPLVMIARIFKRSSGCSTGWRTASSGCSASNPRMKQPAPMRIPRFIGGSICGFQH